MSREVNENITDCGRPAATTIRIQPWEFVAVAEREMLRAIARYPKRTHEETDQRSAECAAGVPGGAGSGACGYPESLPGAGLRDPG
ncbi:MAG: hypothetical protein ACLPX8_01255 [Bryobacteraceae bacterium]